MLIEIKLPALSPSMEHGTLVQWRVSEGARVARGEVIAEIETDKSVLEIESPGVGVLVRRLFEAGTEEIPIGSVLAILSDDGTDPDPRADKSGGSKAPDEPVGRVARDDGPAKLSPGADGSRLLASPLAKSMARDANVDLARLSGTGPNGRVIRRDVEDAISNRDSTAAKFRDVELSRVRKAIALRLQQSKQSIPHFYLSMDVRLDRLLSLREEINRSYDGLRLSINDFIIRACALALRECPRLNAHFVEDRIREFRSVDIAVATSIDDGLVTPVVRGADKLSVQQISKEVRELTARAKAGRLRPDEYQDGTFTVSNLGMFHVSQFDAIINPPQVAILAVGTASKMPVVVQDTIIPGTVMRMTLSCDHRVVDGKEGSGLLSTIKGYLEDTKGLV